MITEEQQCNLREKFNPDGSSLRKQQIRMLDMLCEVDRICRKYNLKYWIGSGTAIGAVRHGGFIPWDDDLDIEMLREDYLKFIKIAKRELNKNYILQDDDPLYLGFYTKIIDLKSEITLLNANSWLAKMQYRGIFIDVFPMEHCNQIWSKICGQIAKWLVGRWFNLRIKNRTVSFVINVNYFIIQKIIFPAVRLLQIFTPKNSMTFGLGIGFLHARKFNEIFPLKEYEFEGKKVFGPNNIDAYLKRLYGNYMVMPQMDKIEQHSANVIFFD